MATLVNTEQGRPWEETFPSEVRVKCVGDDACVCCPLLVVHPLPKICVDIQTYTLPCWCLGRGQWELLNFQLTALSKNGAFSKI